MNYREFFLQYPHLSVADYDDYILFLSQRDATEAWHETVDPQKMKEFFDKALPNWKTKNKRVPNPISEYLIEYAEEWKAKNHIKYNNEEVA